MKSIEEKAKAYDEAIKRIEDIKTGKCEITFMFTEDLFEHIFPELKESEDERTRKEIITFIVTTPKERNNHKKWIAWLEKQGEQKTVDEIAKEVCKNKTSAMAFLKSAGIMNEKGELAEQYRQGEQKPADNAEPKFHKGDWVVYCNDDVDLITGIEENGYCINNGGYIPFVCENEMRLWNITDAKVGDVLVSESNCGLGTWYCIFKSLDGDESMTVYCYLTRDGRFETKKELCFDKDPYNTKPATKEQRDTLFAKMKDAGYIFDFDKKELKKIEGTTAWSEEDEKQARQIERIVHDDGCTQKLQKQIADWFKSLKERVQPQPKQEWSEEDEYCRHQLIVFCKNCMVQDAGAKRCANWLKSLRPQNTWRPCDEQMDALNYVVNLMASSERPTENDLYYNILKSLRQQLKKLREK